MVKTTRPTFCFQTQSGFLTLNDINSQRKPSEVSGQIKGGCHIITINFDFLSFGLCEIFKQSD